MVVLVIPLFKMNKTPKKSADLELKDTLKLSNSICEVFESLDQLKEDINLLRPAISKLKVSIENTEINDNYDSLFELFKRILKMSTRAKKAVHKGHELLYKEKDIEKQETREKS